MLAAVSGPPQHSRMPPGLEPVNILVEGKSTAENAESAEKNLGVTSALSAFSAVKITDFGLAKEREANRRGAR